jgi:hypothetical protein
MCGGLVGCRSTFGCKSTCRIEFVHNPLRQK